MQEKRIKIAYFLGTLDRGGMETLLLDVLHQAAGTPGDVLLLYSREGNISHLFRETPVKMIRVTPRPGIDLPFLWRLRRVLLRERVDVVHAQHPLQAAHAWIASTGTRVKVVETIHGYDFGQTRKGARVLAWMLRHARLNIFVSETQRAYYSRAYRLPGNGRQVVVYNGVRFDKIPSRPANDPSPGDEQRHWTLGMVGSFVPVRDQMTVCRFLALARDRGISFHFFFAGEVNTPDGEACRRYCLDRGLLPDAVTFLGVRDDIPALLARLDAFVYATRHDTFGIAVVEAIAAALPVFVNDWEVTREVTDEGALATIYKTGDEHDLLLHFLDFTTRPRHYREQAAVAAARVRDKYDIRRHVARLHDCYTLACK